MNLLHRYTLRSLLCSRSRTLVTIIGIILSAAMLTAVTTLVSSTRRFMTDCIVSANGGWYCGSVGITGETAEAAKEDSRTEWAAELECIGCSPFEEGADTSMPYLCLEGMRGGFADLMPVYVTSGRLPESPDELILPEHLLEQTSFTASIGDTLTLPVCDRVSDGGQQLWQFDPVSFDENGRVTGEEAVRRGTRTYTVVGFYLRPSFEEYTAPGYTCLTVADGGTDTVDAWFRLTDPNDTYSFITDHLTERGSVTNTELLRLTGSSGESSLNTVLRSLGALLICIILTASVLLIYNAFSISVSERTRQFGLLLSVGATRRQLFGCVLYEALLLSAVGIPLGILSGIGGIGITLALTSDRFESFFSSYCQGVGVSMGLYVSPAAVLTAAGLGLVTVLISACIPAIRLRRLTAVEAIRSNKDVRISPRSVRIPRLTQRLFGAEGMLAAKSFRRARRKYRVTVCSLSVSIVLFITASGFCDRLTDAAGEVLRDSSYDLVVQYQYEETEENSRALHTRLSAVDGVEKASFIGAYYFDAEIPVGAFNTDYPPSLPVEPVGTDAVSMYAVVVFVDDGNYAEYVRELGLDESEYLGGERLIAVNSMLVYNPDEGKYYEYSPLGEPTAVSLDGTETVIGCLTEKAPTGADMFSGHLTLICPMSALSRFQTDELPTFYSCFSASAHRAVAGSMTELLRTEDQPTYMLTDQAEQTYSSRSLLIIVKVFSYGFIVLISLIALANVVNTISTNLLLRRREFAALMSVGMSPRSFRRMLNYECLLYGLKGLMYGLPLSFLTTWLVHSSISSGLVRAFRLPWGAVGIAVASVFIVVFATMLYTTGKLKGCDLITTMREE